MPDHTCYSDLAPTHLPAWFSWSSTFEWPHRLTPAVSLTDTSGHHCQTYHAFYPTILKSFPIISLCVARAVSVHHFS